jgi:lysozyme
MIKIHEGFRASAYRCTANKLTIGYGFNLERDKANNNTETRQILKNFGYNYDLVIQN